jgi:anti-anti-sigma factor
MAQGGKMTIEHAKISKSTVVLTLFGRLDTANAPILERRIKQWENDITEIILDFSGLDYISSMGLRVLLQAKKTLKNEGRQLVIKNMSSAIREVFEMTGFLKLMVDEEKFVVIRKDEPDGVVLSLNGQMETESVPMVAEELSAIKKQKNPKLHDKYPVTVILDMKNLSFISPEAAKQLKQAITDTAWEQRKLEMRNVSVDLQAELGE